MLRFSISGLSLLLLIACSGCGGEQVESYRVSKDIAERQQAPQPTTPPPPASMRDSSMNPQLENQTAGIPDATWQAPGHWVEAPGSAMRKGTFQLDADTELAITAFPGDVGGLLANVNRWRNQIGLGAVSAEELAADSQSHPVGGFPGTIVFMAPDNPTTGNGIMGAIVSLPSATWFFKVTGPVSTLEAERNTFDAFLHTVSFQDSGYPTP